MKKILLTGGAGYIGSHVTNLLIDKGFDVTIIDSLITGNKTLLNPKAKFNNLEYILTTAYKWENKLKSI